MTLDIVKFDSLKCSFGWIGYAITDQGMLGISLSYGNRFDALRAIQVKIDQLPACYRYSSDKIRSSEKWHLFIQHYFPSQSIEIFSSLDKRHWTRFQEKVYRKLVATTKPGECISYGELSFRIGLPGGSRAVGGAMKRNPIPLIIPCHRVVKANGELHRFSAQGGLPLKQKLLEIEKTFIKS